MRAGRRCCAILRVLDADIRSYLEAENAYTEAVLGGTAALQKKLVAEMRGRIKEDDSSVPSPDGPFEYFSKYREGGQHEMIGRSRRDGGDTRILLDGDALAAQSSYFRFGGARHSTGSPPAGLERRCQRLGILHDPRSRLGDGHDPTIVEETGGDAVWTAASDAFFYVKLDDNHRPLQVYLHRLGTTQAEDRLVYEEKDTGWFTQIRESASGRFCVIAGGDHETSEQRLIDLTIRPHRRGWSRRARPASAIRSTTVATNCSSSPMRRTRSISRSLRRR